MADTPEFIALVDVLRAALDAAFRRGQADERRRIREMLGTDVTSSTMMPATTTGETIDPAFNFGMTDAPDDKPKRRRAPMGAPEALVLRVLSERGAHGAAAADIEEAAQTDIEKMVSLSGIRFVLDKGRSAGRFRNELGRWFLVAEEGKN